MSNTKRNIEIILDLPGNRKCADCASLVDQDTGWASLNLGVVMCIQCAGIHRAMGTHITKIRSFRLDTNAWTDKITNIFTSIGGNDRANDAVWESNLPSFWINPKIDKGSDAIRNQFVKSKYEKQLFLPPDQLRGRVNNCLRKMPIDVRQIECDFWVRGDKKYKKNEFLVIHSRWLSRYSSSKKSKAAQQIDLTNFKIIIEENTTGFEEYDGYEFSLYEDTKYIVDHTKELDMYNDANEEKNIHKTHDNIQSPNVFAHDEPLLRCRIKEFKQFVNAVQDVRSTMAYYRVYDSLFEIDTDDPPLNLICNDLELTTTKFLGFAKIGWSKRYFACINGFIYQFKEDISHKPDIVPTALSAYDLQIIDCVLDENGQRSGSKFAVLIINGNKTISLKFQSGPEAIVFFTKIKACWTATRGKYYVDFSVDPPEISGEANAPQPIQIGNASPKHRQKSTFFMPNPQNGTPLTSPKEQDALILNLIEEYEREKKKHRAKCNNSSLDIDSNAGGDISSTQTGSGSIDGYEDSGKFELSESDDPLYRQVSQMTAQEKKQLENAVESKQQNVQISYIDGIPTYQKNLTVPTEAVIKQQQQQIQQQQQQIQEESMEEDEEQVMPINVNTIGVDNDNEDSDSYHTETATAQSANGILGGGGSLDAENAFEKAMVIEQQMTIKKNTLDDTEAQKMENGYENEAQNQMENGYGNGYENEYQNGPQNEMDNKMDNEIQNEMQKETVPAFEPHKPLYKAPNPEEQIYNPEVTKKRMSGIVAQMKATLEKDIGPNKSDDNLPQPLPEHEIESKQEFKPKTSSRKKPINIKRDSKTYKNPAIDGAANLSISALLRRQQEPESDDNEDQQQPKSYNDENIDGSTNVSVSALLKKQRQKQSERVSALRQTRTRTRNSITIKKQNEPEPSPEIVESTNISVSALLKKQKQQQQQQPAPQPQSEPTPEIVQTTNLSVSALLKKQQQPEIETEQKQNETESSPDIVETTNLSVSALLKRQNQSQPEPEIQIEPEPSPEIIETSNISVSSLLNKQKQQQPEPEVEIKPEPQPQYSPEPSPDIVETANVSVSALLNKQKQQQPEPQIEIEQKQTELESQSLPEPEPYEPESSPEIVETANVSVSALLKKQNKKSEPEPEAQTLPQPEIEYSPEPSPDIVETSNLSVSALLKQQQQQQQSPPSVETDENKKESPKQLEPPCIDTGAEIMRKDSNKSRTLSPKMSLTKQSEDAINMAAIAAEGDNDDIEPIPKSVPSPVPKPPESKPKPNNIINKNSNLSETSNSKSYRLPNTFGTSTGMNKAGSVSAMLSMFNAKNNQTTNGPNKWRKKRRKKKVPMNGNNIAPNASANTVDTTTTIVLNGGVINENSTVTVQKLETEPVKKRRHKKRRHKHRKETVVIPMAHLKITRWFNIDQTQLAKLNNALFINTLQQQLAKYGILSLRKDKFYIKLQISRRIALPQRQQHWNNTMQLVQNKLQGQTLIEHETIVND